MDPESLNTVLIKRKSWSKILELITPYIAPKYANMVNPAHELWDSIPLDRQRQIWVSASLPSDRHRTTKFSTRGGRGEHLTKREPDNIRR